MKSIFSILLLSLTAFHSMAFSVELLQEWPIPDSVSSAVRSNYNLGRHNADSGGISQIHQFAVTKDANLFNIIKAVIHKDFGIIETACNDYDANQCARKILERDEDVRANYQPKTAKAFLMEMYEWFGYDEVAPAMEHEWRSSIYQIESYIEKSLGEEYREYGAGFDYIADVFTFILVSKDLKRLLLISGDIGA